MGDEVQLETFRPIAKQALEQGYRAPVKLRDVYWLKIALHQEAENKFGLKSNFDLYKGIGDALALICAKCCVYTRDAVNSLCAFNPDELARKQVSYGGPNVRSLLEGTCPGCCTDRVEAFFNVNLLDQRFGKDPFIIGEAHIFVEGGAPKELGANILRTLQPTSCERNKELKFTVYPVSASWPESRQHMIIHATAVLMKYGVRWEPGDGKNEFQTGEAHGKRFFALYLPQKQVAATPQPSG